jgi:hypothetical protein
MTGSVVAADDTIHTHRVPAEALPAPGKDCLNQ